MKGIPLGNDIFSLQAKTEEDHKTLKMIEEELKGEVNGSLVEFGVSYKKGTNIPKALDFRIKRN